MGESKMKKLNEALIVLDADVETAEDCIRLAGEMFEKNGYVNAGYADAVVEREKEYPTGLPGKGINDLYWLSNLFLCTLNGFLAFCQNILIGFSFHRLRNKQFLHSLVTSLFCFLIRPYSFSTD